MDTFRQQSLDLWRRWQAMSLPNKLAWSVGVFGSFALAGLLWWASQPEYRVLYPNLSAEDAGPIIAALKSKGIPYKLNETGSILVPVEQTHQALVDVAAAGAGGNAKMGKGLESLDQAVPFATPHQQHVNFLRAQQVELARTITQIEPIVSARVHIVRPEPSPFMRDQKPTTASVMVKLRSGSNLNRNTAMSIAALVSHAVEGLSKENVRIVDANGRLLSMERNPETGATGSLIEMRQDLEQNLARKAESMLELGLGQGKAIVRITADINTKVIKKREEKITGEGRPKSEKSVTNKSTATGSSKGGIAGAGGNLGKGGASSGGASGVINLTENTQVDYDLPRTIIEWQNRPGAIERLTIAAFVDVAALSNTDPPISIDDVKETIKKAVGFKSDRDEIQVMAVKLPTTTIEPLEDDSASQAHMQTILTLVRNVSIGAIALCVLPIVWMLFRRRVAAPAVSTVENAPLQRLADELERNPEALAKILAHWMEQPETSAKKAA